MQPELESQLGFQPDIYQRYGFLARVVDAVFGGNSAASPPRVRLLDVGSGPVRLTESFLPAWVDVIRTDVSAFDDPSIVPMEADGSLPFADGSMDIVLAMDVLEHVPKPQRAGVIAECQRVAARCVFLGGPVHTTDVVAAERAFAAFAKRISGRDITFLEEHARFGLPEIADIVGAFGEGWHVVTANNSPLAEWQVFNAIDFIYASDLGDGEAKHATNALINRRAPFLRAEGAHYRQFVCGFRNLRDADAMSGLVASAEMTGAPLPAGDLAEMSTELFARVRADLRHQFERVNSERDAAIAGLDDHRRGLQDAIAAKERRIGDLTEALVEKEARIGNLVGALAEKETALGEAEKAMAALRQTANNLVRQVTMLEGHSGERLAHIERAEQQVAAQTSLVEQLNRKVDQLHGSLAAVRSSLSWKLTRPIRFISQAAQAVGNRDADRAATPAPPAPVDPLNEAQRRGYDVISSSSLFDPDWYRRQSPDAGAAADPLVHYLTQGAAAGLSPHWLFDPAFYLAHNPDVGAAGIDALLHYLTCGVLEGRQPHPLFDGTFYLAANPDVGDAGLDPLIHYVTHGAAERRTPHPLFDPIFYASQSPELADNDSTPLAHYLSRGAREGLDPHPLFDTSFYLEQNPDVAASAINPLVHFVLRGAREQRSPHPAFDTSYYLEQNPDLAATGFNPLVHYVTVGVHEGRRTKPEPTVDRHDYTPPEGLIPWFNPLTLSVSDVLAAAPRLNVLVPGLAMKHMSGGPNTAIALACALAARGVAIRFMSTDAAVDADSGPFWAHVKTIARMERLPAHMELVDAHDRSRATRIGVNDLFLATAWWTAQQAKYAARLTKQQTFLYLIQDYEPLLHAASTQYALAGETYELPHLPIINTGLLHEFLTSHRIGRFGDDAFARQALVFEPALDQRIFFPRTTPRSSGTRRLLFYARPTNGLRNLFEMGVAALQKAIDDGVFEGEAWEFLGMGEPFVPVALGSGMVLRPAAWVNLEGYARQMRDSDVLLSLMLSPHPSYPPLEMAASGGLAVTTTFANKSTERLTSLSPNIIGVPATIESIATGLAAAVRRLPQRPLNEERLRDAHLALPQTWADSFAPILPGLLDELSRLQGSPSLPVELRSNSPVTIDSPVFPGFEGWARNAYDIHRRSALLERRRSAHVAQSDLISFLTTAWNTDPVYLEQLAASVFGQDGGTAFEWVVLDNGSTRDDTRACLARIAQHPSVHLHRVADNLGIVGGMRLCFERARNRYVIPLDSDDLLTPDAVRVLTTALVRAGYPALAYSDEDKLEGNAIRDPYLKPDWDPVLFVNSCYIAHLCAIDRRIAGELGVYTDPATDGCHDWDTFSRFYLAGHTPLHVQGVLYSWRMHLGSTSGNFRSKPYVFASHQRVLNRVLASAPVPDLYELQPSPLFNETPDWWIRRVHRDPWPITTVLVTPDPADLSRVEPRSDFPHQIVRLDPSDGLQGLQEIAVRGSEAGGLLHLLWPDTTIEEPEWAWEAMAHVELFPDTVMIGGRVHDGRRIRMAGRYFGFGSGCDSPDRGRSLDDPGYFAQMWKQHSVSAVSIQHCVIRSDFLADALHPLVASGVSLAGLGPWLGAGAREQGRRVVYSPFFVASTGIDLEAAVSDVERAAFRSAYRHLIPETRYLSPSIGLSPATAYRAVADRVRLAELAAPSVSGYQEWSTAERLARAVRHSDGNPEPTFSLLTTLYSGTKADLFRETARSLFDQSRPFAEWIVLVHGPIPSAVESELQEFADPRVRVLRHDVNVGIINGLGLCLQQASCDYVIPMDADDLLTQDALQILAAEIRARRADLVYSDEDIYRDGQVESPFLRPDFDPVLNGENSYVWHLCAFRRDRALELGVYTDEGAEFCHDWDTIGRFAAAGAAIAHAPHVLYHWRVHASSHSNSGGLHPGSIASTKHVLTRTIARLSDPARYEIAPFPIFRGAEEWCIRRLPVDPPSVVAVRLGAGGSLGAIGLFERCGFPFRATLDDEPGSASGWIARLQQALSDASEYVLVVSGDCRDLDQSGVWEAVKLLELHRDVAIVGGRLVNAADTVVACGTVPDMVGRLVSPIAGLASSDPGPFALALKAHCILSPADGLFMVRTAFLAQALERQPAGLERSDLSAWLGACAIADGLRVAYSPLLQARTRVEAAPMRDDAGPAVRRFLDHLGVAGVDPRSKVLGAGRFLEQTVAHASATHASDRARSASDGEAFTACGANTYSTPVSSDG